MPDCRVVKKGGLGIQQVQFLDADGARAFLATKVTAIAAGYYHNIARRSDGTVVTWGWDYPVPEAATNVLTVAAGWEHCLALRADGVVVAWGDNKYGQSSVPVSATNIIAISAGYYHNLALRADGALLAWGNGSFGVTNPPPASSTSRASRLGRLQCRSDRAQAAWIQSPGSLGPRPRRATTRFLSSRCLLGRRT